MAMGKDYKLIFMDVSMPIMDGYEATYLIKQMDKPAPFIAGLTGHTTDSYKNKCFESGMDYFSKQTLQINPFSDQASMCEHISRGS